MSKDKPKIVKVKTKAIDMSKANPKAMVGQDKAHIDDLATKVGINGDHMTPVAPNRIDSPCEEVIKNRYNSSITLGRDRLGPRSSGYGAKGDSHAASIDLVAGLGGIEAGSHDQFTGKPLWRDPHFAKDAARIYISQKTDIDDNFVLPKGRVGTSKAKSGIAMKADAVRVIAREGIKLVTTQGAETTNSQGTDILSITGVDIIAGSNESELQPMVKGDNLTAGLKELAKHVEALAGIVDSMLMNQMKYNKSLMNHWHNSPFFAQPTTPSFIAIADGADCMITALTEVKKSLVLHKTNLGKWSMEYCEKSGPKYISSRWNNVN